MGFFKAALALFGWVMLCLAILNIPVYHKISSRVTLSLLLGCILANNITLFPENLWLNLLVWIAIAAAVTVPLTLLPRIKCAGTFLVAYLPFYAVMRLIVDKIIPILFKGFEKTVWTTVIVWGVSLVGAVILLISVKDQLALPELNRKWVKISDRVIASVIGAVSILSPMLLYAYKLWLFCLAAAIGAVILYFFDVLVFDWYVRTDFDPPLTPEEEEAMARREERREKRRNSLPAKMLRGAGRFGLGTLHLGGKLIVGVANLIGADIDNPIPGPDIFTNPYEQMEKDYYDHILPQREREEEARLQKESEDAIRYYDENYR